MIRVAVRLNGPLAQRLGARAGVELGDAATVADLLTALARDTGLPLDAVAVHADGRMLARETPLADGASVAVLAPTAGG